MDRESWGVDPEFYELAGTDVALDNVGRNVEVVWVLGVHGNTVHQLIFVGELLVAELLLQVVHLICIENSQPDCRFVRRCPFNSVFFVGRNVHKIAELKFSQYCSRLELKPRFILQNNAPVSSSWLYQKPSGETWPWETIRSIRTLAALSSVVRKLSGCAGINRFGIENESILRRKFSQLLRPSAEGRFAHRNCLKRPCEGKRRPAIELRHHPFRVPILS